MNDALLLLRYLGDAMKRALLSAFAAFGTVTLAGVLFGWPYALLIGFTLAFAVWITSRKG